MMVMEPWYKVTTPRQEVREGRSFNPDEFAIHLEQVVSGRGTEDYREPDQFFSRNVFTRALTEHAGMVLRRLAGKTENTAPVLTLITQFGGGKTHTLTTLYHLAKAGKKASAFPGVPELLHSAGVAECPGARVAVFVGNAWDPRSGAETPWLDVAAQLAGAEGIQALGEAAKTTAPGTEALARLFDAAGGRVLILCDEVLNFCNRHRELADGFYAFLQNLTVAMTGTTRGAAVVSLPRSQVEMTEWDIQWQERITKVVRRVAKDLIVLDEEEISEVVRRRLFGSLGPEKTRRRVAKVYADWCFERRAQLPPEWMAVDTATTERGVRELLMSRFEACYPFHPATLSVFQRKWQALPQYQQTRGTLAMLAQWICWAFRAHHREQAPEPLLTLGSAPLHVRGFRSVVLGQLGETRLAAAIESDIAGSKAHSRALDADAKGPLKDIHRRVATTVLFESTGGQTSKIAHLPELRFAVGNPSIDTTSVDNAALALESRAFFIRKVSSDGFQIHHQPTLKKVVNDRKASLDRDKDVQPTMRKAVREKFDQGATVRVEFFPQDSTDIDNIPRLRIIVADPGIEWNGTDAVRDQIRSWTYKRGEADRDFPAALVWCVKKPGLELQEKAEMFLAWQRVQQDAASGLLGAEFQARDLRGVAAKVKEAGEDLLDEVDASYRYVVIADASEPDGIYAIDLGAGHISSGESLCARVMASLRAESRLNVKVGASYVDRNWPEALKQSGAWPLAGLRKCFLDGSLTRLVDPDVVLKTKILEFVEKGDFGLASGAQPDGAYQRVWYLERPSADEVAFENDVYLLRKEKAKAFTQPPPASSGEPVSPTPETDTGGGGAGTVPEPSPGPEPQPHQAKPVTLTVSGSVPLESWNRFGTRLLPKLRGGENPTARVELSCTVESQLAPSLANDIRQVLADLGLADRVDVDQDPN